MAAALGSLLPDEHRLATTFDSGRITLPALDGADTLVEALRRLGSANIELVDVALRRPSLDDVFFALTKESATRTDDRSAAAVTS
jgi:ABC-2 type transport system ATP-binding protein